MDKSNEVDEQVVEFDLGEGSVFSAVHFQDVCLLEEKLVPVKEIEAVRKLGRVPQLKSERDLRYLHEIVEPDIDQELQEVFSALRAAFKFKRKEISVMGPDEGGGVISTPDFNFELFLLFDPQEQGKVLWRRSITGIRSPNRVFCDEFSDVFGSRFKTLEISTNDELDIEEIIDAVEEAEADGIHIDYDKDATWCQIDLESQVTTVRIASNSIRIQSRKSSKPKELLRAFFGLNLPCLQD